MARLRAADCCAALVRSFLRIVNYLLALMGIAMCLYAALLYKDFQEAQFPNPGPTTAPSPVPAFSSLVQVPRQPLPPSSVTGDDMSQRQSMPDGPTDIPISGQLPGARKMLFDVAGEANRLWLRAQGKIGQPWFIFALGGVGVFTLVTASTGILGGDCGLRGNRCCLSMYSFLLITMLAAQLAVALAFFLDRSWEKHLPPDTSGDYEKVKHFIEQRLTVCKWLAVGVLGLQVTALLLACLLYILNEAAEDEDDARSETAQQPLLPPSSPPPHSSGLQPIGSHSPPPSTPPQYPYSSAGRGPPRS